MSAILFGKSCNFARSVHLHIRLFLFARGQLYCWHDFTNLTVRRAKRGFQPFSCLLLQTCIAKTCQVRGKVGLYMYATRAVQAQIGNLWNLLAEIAQWLTSIQQQGTWPFIEIFAHAVVTNMGRISSRLEVPGFDATRVKHNKLFNISQQMHYHVPTWL